MARTARYIPDTASVGQMVHYGQLMNHGELENVLIKKPKSSIAFGYIELNRLLFMTRLYFSPVWLLRAKWTEVRISGTPTLSDRKNYYANDVYVLQKRFLGCCLGKQFVFFCCLCVCARVWVRAGGRACMGVCGARVYVCGVGAVFVCVRCLCVCVVFVCVSVCVCYCEGIGSYWSGDSFFQPLSINILYFSNTLLVSLPTRTSGSMTHPPDYLHVSQNIKI